MIVQLAVAPMTCVELKSRSMYRTSLPMPSTASAARIDGSASIALASAKVSRGLCSHLQTSSEPSQFSKLIGNRLRMNVVGPDFSKSRATLALMP